MNTQAQSLNLQPRKVQSTPHQRLYIRTMLSQLDLPVGTTNLQIGYVFRAAKLDAPTPGRAVDDVLQELTRQQASDLINALKKEWDDACD